MRACMALLVALMLSVGAAGAQTPSDTPPPVNDDSGDDASQVARARAALMQRLENADAGVVQFRNAIDVKDDEVAESPVSAPVSGTAHTPVQLAVSGQCADEGVFNAIAESIGPEPIKTIDALKTLSLSTDPLVRQEVLKQLALSYFVIGFFDEAANVASAYQGDDGELALVSAFMAPSPAISPCGRLERLVLYTAGRAALSDGDLNALGQLPAALAQPLVERLMVAAATQGDEAVLARLAPITGAQPEMAPSADVLQALEDARPQISRPQVDHADAREKNAPQPHDAVARVSGLSIAADVARLSRIAENPSGFAALADTEVLENTALAFASIGDDRALKALKLGEHLDARASDFVTALAALRRGDIERARDFARSVADDPEYANFAYLCAVWSADDVLARTAARKLAAAGDHRPLADASWRGRDWRGAVDAYSRTDLADDPGAGLKAAFAAKNAALSTLPDRLSGYQALFATAPTGEDAGAVRQFISNVSNEIKMLKSGAIDG
ncbi:MAG: hypothetical protein KDA46_02215 [Parvularculaceae bacterium]|nr:hypothetical protein [Parvularculaceae bacterium]